MKNIIITVITVCRNAEKTILPTMESVMRQTYPDIEYIIVDGDSSDNTLAMIERVAERFPIQYISEPDSGIYDAMNKGIGLASGEYICFLNAGDMLADRDVVRNVAAEIKKKGLGIYYGSIIYRHPGNVSEVRTYGKLCGKRIYYCTGDCINHQAVFAASSYLKTYKFDTSYKICGDREWMMRMHRRKAKFICMPFIICSYSLDEQSVSISNDSLYHLEAARCMKEYFPLEYVIFCLFEACRRNAFFSRILHGIYRLLYIRKR